MPLFKIIKDSIVKGSDGDYLYCQTEPPHPMAETRPDRKQKLVYLHRVLWENAHDRLLRKDEEIDHKDGDPSNNAISNLVVHTHSSHAQKGEFWKHSPRTKPGKKRKAAIKVAHSFLISRFPQE